MARWLCEYELLSLLAPVRPGIGNQVFGNLVAYETGLAAQWRRLGGAA